MLPLINFPISHLYLHLVVHVPNLHAGGRATVKYDPKNPKFLVVVATGGLPGGHSDIAALLNELLYKLAAHARSATSNDGKFS